MPALGKMILMHKYAVVNDIRMATPFMLDELMVFLGILLFMAVNDKVEYANYWVPQVEDLIYGGVTTSLDGIMTLHRFKLLRWCLSFNATPITLDQDAAARIRPLLNLLKINGGRQRFLPLSPRSPYDHGNTISGFLHEFYYVDSFKLQASLQANRRIESAEWRCRSIGSTEFG
ncbi:Transposase [Phytophthora palmivora]|uniref:Transposase n=1 Tax=Phytophthora palmivora TaxID=4796 RepID=A0A2P4XNN0_9STRA|nr:Transposase [Phytophthora palmivora]